MTVSRLLSAAVTIACLHIGMAHAQSVAGKWQGTVTTPDGPYPATLTLDSTSAGWSGSILAPAYHPDAMPFAAITVRGDSVTMTLPVENATATFRGRIAPETNVYSGQVLVDGGDYGSFTFSRSGSSVMPAKPTR
jgi:hypothetical protein